MLERYERELRGLDMYRVLARSRISVNRHIGIAEYYANNIRLYEATIMGALLLTYKKGNLKDLSSPVGKLKSIPVRKRPSKNKRPDARS